MSGVALIVTGIVVFATHALEAVTGFGCTVLALPFVTALLGVQRGVPILASIAWILALYIVVTKFRYIDFKQFGIIVFFVGLGMPVGMYAFRSLDPTLLERILAIFIIASASWQLWRRGGPSPGDTGGVTAGSGRVSCPAAPHSPLAATLADRWPYFVFLILGGVVHGAFASGGPLVVLYASKALPDKGTFRATLCLLWTSLNTVLLVGYVLSGTFTTPVVTGIGVMLPFLAAGIFVGEKLHNKVDEVLFGRLVFSVLLVTGVFMLIL